MTYILDSVTRLEKYPNVRIADNGSWLDADSDSETGEDD